MSTQSGAATKWRSLLCSIFYILHGTLLPYLSIRVEGRGLVVVDGGREKRSVRLHNHRGHVYIHIACAHRPCLVVFVVTATSLSTATFMMLASTHTGPITNNYDATSRAAPCTVTRAR